MEGTGELGARSEQECVGLGGVHPSSILPLSVPLPQGTR